jgi:hypothetical protein
MATSSLPETLIVPPGDGLAAAGSTPPRRSSRLLQLGLVRNVHASTHLVTFVVAGVSTVVVTRLYLALAGYPQIGGGGLHIAHMLPGGMLMLVALFLLLSYVGPVIRPLAALVGGIGFGLFIDEVGKFVTSDNDYFFRPAPAIMYAVFAAVVIGVEALHGRRVDPREHLANAVDQAVEAVAGGLSERRRADALTQIRAAGPIEGAAETRALIDVCPDDNVEVPAPAEHVRFAVRRSFDRLATKPWTGTVIVLLLAGQVVAALAIAGWSRVGGAQGWLDVSFLGVLAGTTLAAALTLRGALRMSADRARAVRAFQLAVLAFLLVTRVFEFAHNQFSAGAGLLLDLVLLGLTGAELDRLRRVSAGESPPPDQRPTAA